MEPLRRVALLGAIVVCCVSCDQATKTVATAQLAGRPPISLVGDTIRFSYAETPGGFLSLGVSLPGRIRAWVFGLLPAVAVLTLLAVAVRLHSPNRLQLVAVSLLIARGTANIIDRVTYGVVRDFLNIGIGSVRTGVFNVADFAITVSTVLLMADFWTGRVR